MTWPSTPTRYLRRGATNWTGAQIGIGPSHTNMGWEADTSACWYERTYGSSANGFTSLMTVHYKFVVGPPYEGWPVTLPSGTVMANLPAGTPSIGDNQTIVGTWYASTWWGWGGDGLVEHLYTAQSQKLRFLIRGASVTGVNAKWLGTNNSGAGYVSGVLFQADTSIYINVQYEV